MAEYMDVMEKASNKKRLIPLYAEIFILKFARSAEGDLFR